MDQISHQLIGLSRDEVVAILGNPDVTGGTSRKYKTPSIFKYGNIELHFQPWKDGLLCMIWDEVNEIVIHKE